MRLVQTEHRTRGTSHACEGDGEAFRRLDCASVGFVACVSAKLASEAASCGSMSGAEHMNMPNTRSSPARGPTGCLYEPLPALAATHAV